MFFLFPFRVKNPIKHFPYVTLCIILINVIVYIFTTESLLQIREDVMRAYGFSLGNSPAINILTSAFLHAGPTHIISNMVGLWVFGPPVEDRLGAGKYLGLYLLAGLLGALLHGVMSGTGPDGQPTYLIGASGCIFGVFGAYWFIYSWSTVCVAYFIWPLIWIWYGVWEVAAIWVLGGFCALEVLNGFLMRSLGGGGVAHFCHVGGAIAGLAACVVYRVKRDSAAVSDVRAIQADTKDPNDLPLSVLMGMVDEDPGNPVLLRALARPAAQHNAMSMLDEAMAKAGPGMIDKDPDFVGYYLVDINGRWDTYRSLHLIRLAGNLERAGQYTRALEVYRIVSGKFIGTSDAEMSLYRMALCYWSVYKDANLAREVLRQMASQYQNGPMTPFGKQLWNQIALACIIHEERE